MDEPVSIQWFPGHMAKTRRLIAESLKLVDAVAEIIDARIPVSSRNPELAGIVAQKPRLILMNKADAADPAATQRWLATYRAEGVPALAVDCRSGRGLSGFLPLVRELLRPRLGSAQSQGNGRPAATDHGGWHSQRGQILFLSTVLAGASRAKVADRPGVTRGNQWVSAGKGVELLDTAGVLWPKFDDPLVGNALAFTGAVKDVVMDVELLAARLLVLLAGQYPESLLARYKVDVAALAAAGDGGPADSEAQDTRPVTPEGAALLEAVGRRRGMLLPGGVIDTERAAVMVLDEFRGGLLGRFTLELPPGPATGAGQGKHALSPGAPR